MKWDNPCKNCKHTGKKEYILNNDDGLHPWCIRLDKQISYGIAFYCKFKEPKEQNEKAN